MIEKLTKAQSDRFQEFVSKWTAIGLSTEPANRPEAENGIAEAYAIAGLKTPRIVWCGSPLSQGLTRAILLNAKCASVRDSVWDSVRDSVSDSVWDSVSDSVWDSVRASVSASVSDSVSASVRDSVRDSVSASVSDSVSASVRDSVRDSVSDSVWDSVSDSVSDSVWDSVRASVWDSVSASVRDSVWASVWDSVWDSVSASVRASVRASVSDSGYGQHDANWIGFYDFLAVACGLIEQTKKLSGIHRITLNGGWWLPHKNICWIAERHTTLHRNAQGRLHKDEGPALAYPDGFAIYALNGIRMKPEYILTPAEKLSPQTVLTETNVEIRRELLRKIGIERFLAVAKHKVLDKRDNYELLSIELTPEIKDARYLKMINPSIGVFHVEGVHPTCNTVQHAINWRAHEDINKEWKPEILT